MSTPLISWFGYPRDENAISAWGCRAIFKPFSGGDRPLDILWDRQGHYNLEGKDTMISIINKKIIPDLQEYTQHFSTDSSDRICLHYPFDDEGNFVLVIKGSPNGSYGYFYLSVSLVPKMTAPPVLDPVGDARAERERREQELEDWRKMSDARNKKFNKINRDKRKVFQEEMKQRIDGRTPCYQPFEVPMKVGDYFQVEANQGMRDAFVLANRGIEMLYEYWMPKACRRFLVSYDYGTGRGRNYSENSLPKKWKELLDDQ